MSHNWAEFIGSKADFLEPGAKSWQQGGVISGVKESNAPALRGVEITTAEGNVIVIPEVLALTHILLMGSESSNDTSENYFNAFADASRQYHQQLTEACDQLLEKMRTAGVVETHLFGPYFLADQKLVLKVHDSEIPIMGDFKTWMILLQYIAVVYQVKPRIQGIGFDSNDTIPFISAAAPNLLHLLHEKINSL